MTRLRTPLPARPSQDAPRRSRRRLRGAALAIALLATPGLVSACGSSSSAPSATTLLHDTFSNHKHISSGTLDASIDFSATGLKSLSSPFSLKVSGPFASAGTGQLPKFNITLGLTASGTSISAGAISTGSQAFIEFGGTPYVLPASVTQAFKQRLTSSSAQQKGGKTSLAALGINPSNWLSNPQNAGTTSIAGADTYHITATINVGQFLGDVVKAVSRVGQSVKVPSTVPTLTPAQQAQIAKVVKSATVDIYMGKSDHILRRLNVIIHIDVPASERSAVNGLSTATGSFNLTLSNINQPQTITAPANARPLSQLTGPGSPLGGLLGGLAGGSRSGGAGGTSSGGTGTGSGGTTAPGGTGTSGVPSASAYQAYLTCLQQAGGNLAKVQQCAGLLHR